MLVKTEVKGREECPHCGSGKVYGHGMCKPREVLQLGTIANRFTLSSIAGGGSAAIVSAPLLKAGNWCGRVPGLADQLKPRPYGSSRTETSAK